MRKFLALAFVATMAATGVASAACPPGSPDAVTSKPPADANAAADPNAAADAKGIAEDGQHTPMETDPNAPGVTPAAGGTTTNSEQAEEEIAAAGTSADGAAAGTSAESSTAAAGSTDTACVN